MIIKKLTIHITKMILITRISLIKIIKTDQLRAAPQIRPAPHFVVFLCDISMTFCDISVYLLAYFFTY